MNRYDVRGWPARRWLIAALVALLASVTLILGGGLFPDRVVAGAVVFMPGWWTLPAILLASVLSGLVVATYFSTPIGADATMCDTRWPSLGLIATYLATETRSLDPILSGAVRPLFALSALALLIWALRERLDSEYNTTRSDSSADGEVCTTCRPLFPRTSSHTPKESCS
jgi:hypothetical protein